MRISTLRGLCAAAVAVALALPAAAQNAGERTFESGNAPNGARGAAGEAGTAGQAGQGQGATAQPGATTRPGATVRPGAASGAVIQQDGSIESGTRTANFPPQEGQAQGGQQGQLSDQALVRYISAGNEAEIRVNEFAQQQAENEQVKQFAQKMVQEHTQMGDKLRQASQGGQGGQPGATGRPGAEGRNRGALRNESGAGQAGEGAGRRSGAGRNNESGAGDDSSVSLLQEDDLQGRRAGQGQRAGGAMRGGNAAIALHEEIKRQCAESTIAALREKQGAEFDHSFMHQQVVAHMAMLDTLKVTQKHASPNLRPVLQEGQQHAQQHLDQARQILEQLENQRQ